jgi:hypothetical protein
MLEAKIIKLRCSPYKAMDCDGWFLIYSAPYDNAVKDNAL